MNRHRVRAVLLLAALLQPWISGCNPNASHPAVQLNGMTMGTTWSVQVVDPPAGFAPEAVSQSINELLDGINRHLSTYDPQSELSRVNHTESTEPMGLSPDFSTVLGESLRISEQTGGALDVTVGPLVDLWGFGPSEWQGRVPEPARVEAARRHVGYRKLEFDAGSGSLRKRDPRVSIDLSAIAKGYAVDRVAKHLAATGSRNYLVEIGGEVRGHGHNRRGEPWQIAIERPSDGLREVQLVVPLVDRGIATSGDYRNYHRIDNRRFSHTLDPITGRPVTHRLASVSVLHPSAMYADGMATALLVLGPQKGLRLAEQLGLAAYFIVRTDSGFEHLSTRPFQALVPGAPTG